MHLASGILPNCTNGHLDNTSGTQTQLQFKFKLVQPRDVAVELLCVYLQIILCHCNHATSKASSAYTRASPNLPACVHHALFTRQRLRLNKMEAVQEVNAAQAQCAAWSCSCS